MPVHHPPFKPCPCGSGRSYSACCQPTHDGSRASATPEALMRARYAAYALQHADFVQATWHPSTRPPALDLQDGTRYLGLNIHAAEGDEVTFTVRLKDPAGQPGRFTERSRFVQENGVWLYLDGHFLAQSGTRAFAVPKV